jgi:hypothetical protein
MHRENPAPFTQPRKSKPLQIKEKAKLHEEKKEQTF